MPRGRSMKSWRVAAALALLWPVGDAVAHEFWIEPAAFHLTSPAAIVAELKVGQNFKGSSFPYLSGRFLSFKVTDSKGSRELKGDEGDSPAVRLPSPAAGLNVITYHSTADRLHFERWEDFADYVTYEGLASVLDAHRRRGLAPTGIDEVYTRCAKALIQVASAWSDEQDRPTGMPIELVLGANPYRTDRSEIPVTLLWQGKPLADAQIRIFQDNGTVSERVVRTDAGGRAVISLEGGGRFLLNAVHMQEASADKNAAWESYWASLTFEAGAAAGK
jgi:uncharacterized GH25 family protein